MCRVTLDLSGMLCPQGTHCSGPEWVSGACSPWSESGRKFLTLHSRFPERLRLSYSPANAVILRKGSTWRNSVKLGVEHWVLLSELGIDCGGTPCTRLSICETHVPLQLPAGLPLKDETRFQRRPLGFLLQATAPWGRQLAGRTPGGDTAVLPAGAPLPLHVLPPKSGPAACASCFSLRALFSSFLKGRRRH